MLPLAIQGKHSTRTLSKHNGTLVKGIPGEVPYFDDVLVPAANKKELLN